MFSCFMLSKHEPIDPTFYHTEFCYLTDISLGLKKIYNDTQKKFQELVVNWLCHGGKVIALI